MNMSGNDVKQALETARAMVKEAHAKIEQLELELAQVQQENSIQKMARHMHTSGLNVYGGSVDEIVEKLASMESGELTKLAARIQLTDLPAVISLGSVGGTEPAKTANQSQEEETDHWAGFRTSVSAITSR